MIIIKCQTCRKPVKSYHSYRRKFCNKRCYIRIGSKNPKWRGGKIIVSGYVYIYSPNHPEKTQDGYVCEHRLIIEKKIGRYLKRSEAVHHKNGNRTDNRIDNLVLCKSNGRHFIKHHLKRRNKKGQFIS